MQETIRQMFNNLISLRNSQATIDSAEAIVFLDYCRRNLGRSNAQIFQDLFVQFELRDKRNGFFVEFGASDGIENSNTLMLERQYDWKGILAEPGTCWHETLRKTRRAAIETKCVWDRSGATLEFSEVRNPGLAGLSTVSDLIGNDKHAPLRANAVRYPVETISLLDLLEEHQAPSTIDYLSVDTEGAELRVLSAFDFSRYDVRIVTVEHNFAPQRAEIQALMESKGYRRKFELFSYVDDWFVKP